MFDPAPADGVIFHATSGLEATAIAQVRDSVHQRLLRGFVRHGLLAGTMTRGRWRYGTTAAASRSIRRCASRPPTAPGGSGSLLLTPLERGPGDGSTMKANVGTCGL
jgi:hypothetical protein